MFAHGKCSSAKSYALSLLQDGIGDVTIGHVRSLAYNGGNAHLPPIPPSVVKHISKRRADREELAKLCNGRIKLESEQIVTRLEKEIKREPVSI